MNVNYSQNDQAWKNTRLGNSISAGDTIGNYGCNVTAIANVCNWAGTDLNPSEINDICKQNGWFVPSTPGDNDLVGPNDVPAMICGNLQFAGRTNWSGPTDMSFFADASDPNVAYIIEIDASPAAGLQTHFVMAWATSGSDDLIINDSWDGARKKLSHYGTPSKIIYAAMKFLKIVPPAPEPAPAPVEAPAPQPDPTPVITQPETPSEQTPESTPTPDPVETPPADPTPTPSVPTVPEAGTSGSEVPADPKPVIVATSPNSFLRSVWLAVANKWNTLPDTAKRILHTVWQVAAGVFLTGLTTVHTARDVQGLLITAYAAGFAALKAAVLSLIAKLVTSRI